MKIIAFVFSVFFFYASTDLQAGGFYYRLWQGQKRFTWPSEAQTQKFSWAQTPSDYYGWRTFYTDDQGDSIAPGAPLLWRHFHLLVNEALIPATVSCCAKESLLAYMPVMTPLIQYRDSENETMLIKNDEVLHGELALIVYKSKEAYESWRSLGPNENIDTVSAEKLEAITYGPLHADVFNMPTTPEAKMDIESSRSVVPVIYPGKISWPATTTTYTKEVAYDLLGSTHDWQDPKAEFLFRYWRKTDVFGVQKYLDRVESYLNHLKKSKSSLGLLNYVVLINDQYVVEFILAKDATQFAQNANFFTSEGLHLYLVFETKGRNLAPLNSPDSESLRYPDLNFGEAARVLFTPGELPKKKVKHWLLKRE